MANTSALSPLTRSNQYFQPLTQEKAVTRTPSEDRSQKVALRSLETVETKPVRFQAYKISVSEDKNKTSPFSNSEKATAVFAVAVSTATYATYYFLESVGVPTSAIPLLSVIPGLLATTGIPSCHRSLFTGTTRELNIDSNGALTGINADKFSRLNTYAWNFNTWNAIQPNFSVYVQTKLGTRKPSEIQFQDAAFDTSLARHLDDSFLAFTWALTDCRNAVLDEGYRNANKGIAMTKEALNSAIDQLFQNSIAVGGFRNPNTGIGGYTYSQIAQNGPHQLFTFNLPVPSSFSHQINTAIIFHEILHSWGFSHNFGSDPNEYADRTKAILALEDAMKNVVSRYVVQRCNSVPLRECAVFGNYSVGSNPGQRSQTLPLPAVCAGNPNPPTPAPPTTSPPTIPPTNSPTPTPIPSTEAPGTNPPVTSTPTPTPVTETPTPVVTPITEMPIPREKDESNDSGKYMAIGAGIALAGVFSGLAAYGGWRCITKKTSHLQEDLASVDGARTPTHNSNYEVL